MSSVRRMLSCAALVVASATSSLGFAAPKDVGLRDVEVTEAGAFGRVRRGGARERLTLEPRLQRFAERQLSRSGAHEAAIVVSDTRTGRILAWASRGDRDYVATPFAPSASLFKLVTASALLESGKALPSTRVCFSGGSKGIRPEDLEGRGATCLPMSEALGRSENLFFARLAKQQLARADLEQMGSALGFAGAVPIDVPVGASAVDLPDDEFGRARAAAGFWAGTLTPLGALFAMQTIANGGERVRLRVLARSGETRSLDGRALSSRSALSLRRMLEVTTRRGTCARVFRRPDGARALGTVAVAAKTGTLIGARPRRMYSWFTAFAPADAPEIAVAVMLGNDLVWHTKANIVGRDLLAAYFGPRAAPR